LGERAGRDIGSGYEDIRAMPESRLVSVFLSPFPFDKSHLNAVVAHMPSVAGDSS
jgi:hypothetical protein